MEKDYESMVAAPRDAVARHFVYARRLYTRACFACGARPTEPDGKRRFPRRGSYAEAKPSLRLAYCWRVLWSTRIAGERPAPYKRPRYGDSALPRQILDPGLLVDEQSETTDLTFIDYVTMGKSTDPHGMPASVSTAVVTGTIMGGQCFITGSRNFVYTDYRLRIDEIFKNDSASDLKIGALATATRPGGAIHFPSGHRTNFLNPEHGLPIVGSQYVLFLWKPIPNVQDYEIVFASGYELKDGWIHPLDEMNAEYDGMKIPVFLDILQKALAPAGGPQ